MATCLVTGGSGFLGSHLCDALMARGHRVICVDNFDTGSLANIHHLRDLWRKWLSDEALGQLRLPVPGIRSRAAAAARWHPC